ncbi:hypothetical protein C8Q79DRAFT_995003 [Trametes meyenii]|nr:hypothetical protein C8Q79DRAFT_995003 [Trametes meyenii]
MILSVLGCLVCLVMSHDYAASGIRILAFVVCLSHMVDCGAHKLMSFSEHVEGRDHVISSGAEGTSVRAEGYNYELRLAWTTQSSSIHMVRLSDQLACLFRGFYSGIGNVMCYALLRECAQVYPSYDLKYALHDARQDE